MLCDFDLRLDNKRDKGCGGLHNVFLSLNRLSSCSFSFELVVHPNYHKCKLARGDSQLKIRHFLYYIFKNELKHWEKKQRFFEKFWNDRKKKDLEMNQMNQVN